MQKFKQLMAAAAVMLAATSTSAVKVYTIGDSTMANYDENATVTRGWGMYLQQFLCGDIQVSNHGKGGADTRSFYEGEAYWQTVKKQMQAGDYVLIQFAHNDEKNGGMDGTALKAYYQRIGDNANAEAVDVRGTVPSETYKEYLQKYIEETRALGGIPVLVAPVCRSYFTGNEIRRNGRHDLGDNFSILTENGPTSGNKVPTDDHTMDYVWHMKAVADEADVLFIDLTTATKELYESYGETKCLELLFDGTGSTHFNTTGATLVARQCAQLMKNQGILADYISLTSDISVSPENADFGKAYKGQSLTKEFSLSGFNLSPENGTVSITATGGIGLSVDKKAWTASLTADYTASTLIQTFYAQVTLEEEGETTGTITISTGDKRIEIPVKATAVSLSGGEEVNAYWRLEQDDSYILTGPATVVPESWEGMYVQRYASPNANTIWPEETGFDASRKVQRNLIAGDNWPDGDIDENPNRYIQFGIQAAAGTTLKIDEISMYICGAGGNGMKCHVNYSTETNFADQHTIYAPAKMTANTMEKVIATPVISLEEGQELLVRIYPWYDGAASGKTICISDVTIHGFAMEATSVGHISTENGIETIRTNYYNLNGTKNNHPFRGVNIVIHEMSDGSVRTEKNIF